MRKIFSMFCVIGLVLYGVSAIPANAEEPKDTYITTGTGTSME